MKKEREEKKAKAGPAPKPKSKKKPVNKKKVTQRIGRRPKQREIPDNPKL